MSDLLVLAIAVAVMLVCGVWEEERRARRRRSDRLAFERFFDTRRGPPAEVIPIDSKRAS